MDITTFDFIPAGWDMDGKFHIRTRHGNAKAAIHRYPEGTSTAGCRYCWQVWRDGHGVSGATETLGEALDLADKMMRSPMSTFNARRRQELQRDLDNRLAEINQITRQLIALCDTQIDDPADQLKEAA